MLVLARAKSALPLLEENDAIVRREVLRFTMMLEETLSYIRDYRSQPNFHQVLCMPSAFLDFQHSTAFSFAYRYYLALNIQNGNGCSMLAPRRAPNRRKHLDKHVSSGN